MAPRAHKESAAFVIARQISYLCRPMEETASETRCRNCDTVFTGNFCPNCGQSAATSRLQPRSFFIDMLKGLLRVNRGFLFTGWNLLTHPWLVIRDYIQCRRVTYTPPVNMLVILCFIATFLAGLENAITATAVSAADEAIQHNSGVIYRIGLSFGQFFSGNSAVVNIMIYLPALLAIPVVYRNRGAKRYNAAEYFAALIYMIDAFILFDILMFPLNIADKDISGSIVVMYGIYICCAGLYNAFPMESKPARVRFFVYYLITALLFYTMIAIGFASIRLA